MPKKKNNVLTRTLYTYCEPKNRQFAVKMAKELKTPGGYSGYINGLLTAAREKVESRKKSA